MVRYNLHCSQGAGRGELGGLVSAREHSAVDLKEENDYYCTVYIGSIILLKTIYIYI